MAAVRLKTGCKIAGGITLGLLCTVQAIKKAKRRELITFASDVGEEENYQLVHAQIAFRHGARTPIFRLPKMQGRGKDIDATTWDKDVLFGELPHTLIKYTVRHVDGGEQPSYSPSAGKVKILKGGSPVGQLTKVGQQQMYNLGKELQRRYISGAGLISPVYSPHEIYVRSTNVPRTIQSAKCVAAGMYGKESIPEGVTIVTVHEAMETIMPNMYYCPLLARWGRDIEESPSIHINLKDYQQNAAILKQDLGITTDKFYFVHFRDIIAAMEAHDLPVDPVLNQYRDMIETHATQELAAVQCGYPSQRKDIMRVGIGKFLEEILERMKDNINGVSPASHKVCLYSVHDTSLVCLIAALGVFENKWPDFGADLTFELYKNQEDDFFVKVLLQGKEQILPGSGDAFCPFAKFRDLLTPHFIDDWETKCKNVERHHKHRL